MRIKRLHIQKMPGFPHGLAPYEQLADHINIIAGANGTGKSSTARVVQKLIWWDKKMNLQAIADLMIDNLPHKIVIEAPFYEHTDPRGNKSSEDFRMFVPEGFEKQYILALHDLVKGEDGNLAREIIKEVNGGYDLNSAIAALGYTDTIYTTNRSEYKEYQEARRVYLHNRNEQDALKEKSRQLISLKEELQQAKDAKTAQEFYTGLMEWKEIKRKQDHCLERLSAYSPVLEKIRPDDYAQILALEQKISGQHREILALEERASEAVRLLQQLNLPEELDYNILLDELDNYKEELRERKKCIETLQSEIRHSEVSLKEAAAAIGKKDLDTLSSVTPEIIKELDPFIREANLTEEEYRLLAEQREMVRTEIAERQSGQLETEDPEAIRSEILQLSQWLKKETSSSSGWTEIFVFLIIALLTAGATLFGGAWGLCGLIIMVGVVVYYRYASVRGRKEEGGQRTNKEAVSRLEELTSQLRLLDCLQGLRKQEKEINIKLNRLEEKRTKNRQAYETWATEMGLSFSDMNTSTEQYNTFYYIIQHLLRWQKSSVVHLQKTGELADAEQRYAQLLEESNKRLGLFGNHTIETCERLDAVIKELRRQVALRQEYRRTQEEAKRLLLHTGKQCEADEATLCQIYTRLGLTPDNKEVIRQLTDQAEEYQKLKKEYENNLVIQQERHSRLKLSPFYREEWEALTPEEIYLRQEKNAAQSERYESLYEEIKNTEAKINLTESGSVLENTIDRQDKALHQLEEAFESNLQAVTGSLIAGQLRKEISLNNENKVFREANHILGDITQQRYGLTLSDMKDSVFMAIDHLTGQVLTLEELSTGTRVQLLLAIRLAYIRSLEKEVKLPVLADELLANSDDQRSEAIIRSLITFSKERQVFYFTAQADEVVKWEKYLSQSPGISSKIIILGEDSRMQSFHRPEIEPVVLVNDIPAPGQHSYVAYGRLLKVPPFNLLEQKETELHLWYLFNDTAMLYHYTRRGIHRWGQLNAFLKRGGEQYLTEEQQELLYRKAELLGYYLELYRTGRPLPIDKQVVENSGVISDKFMEKVCLLLDECDGNPIELLRKLPEVPRLQKAKVEDFRRYLVENKYIDGKNTLSPEEINLSLLSKIAGWQIEPEEAQRFLSRFTILN